jgi:hypothetical protein
MKKWIPLLIVLGLFVAVGGKFLAAKQYCTLCLSQGYENLVSAPDYFCDTVVTVLPALF